jgi:hypothetical protein
VSVPAASVSGQKYGQISLGSFIFPLVTVTQQIPVEQRSGLGLHEGDTLHVLSRLDSAFSVQIVHLREIAPSTGSNATEWLRTGRGSVHLNAGEEGQDLRMSRNMVSIVRSDACFFGYEYPSGYFAESSRPG